MTRLQTPSSCRSVYCTQINDFTVGPKLDTRRTTWNPSSSVMTRVSLSSHCRCVNAMDCTTAPMRYFSRKETPCVCTYQGSSPTDCLQQQPATLTLRCQPPLLNRHSPTRFIRQFQYPPTQCHRFQNRNPHQGPNFVPSQQTLQSSLKRNYGLHVSDFVVNGNSM